MILLSYDAVSFYVLISLATNLEQQLAQEQVLELLPLVGETNAISEELDKHKYDRRIDEYCNFFFHSKNLQKALKYNDMSCSFCLQEFWISFNIWSSSR